MKLAEASGALREILSTWKLPLNLEVQELRSLESGELVFLKAQIPL
jgi:hypothetical protein